LDGVAVAADLSGARFEIELGRAVVVGALVVTP
jgi:hypothetical protein